MGCRQARGAVGGGGRWAGGFLPLYEKHSFSFESFSLAFVHSFYTFLSFSFPSFLSLQRTNLHVGLALVSVLPVGTVRCLLVM